MPTLADFYDPYFTDITESALTLLKADQGTPPIYEVVEYQDELGSETGVNEVINRSKVRPLLLLNVGEATSVEADSTLRESLDRVVVEVIVAAWVGGKLTEQKRLCAAVAMHARKALTGQKVSPTHTSAAAFEFDRMAMLGNDKEMCLYTVQFHLDFRVDLDG